MRSCLENSPCLARPVGWLQPLVLAVVLLAWYGSVAAQNEPDNALFWEISLGDQELGYLLGSIHSEDPRVLDYSETFMAQLTSCQVFAMEMVPDLPTLKRLTEYMHYADAATLEQTLGSERFSQVMDALSAYQVPMDWKSKMKVWAVMMTLSVPPPETGLFMDLSLSLRAAGAGLTVNGLETLDQQLSFLEHMPLDYQLALLDQALADHQRVDEVHRQMVDAYLTGDLSVVSRISDMQFAQLDANIRDYFMRLGISERNQRMAGKLGLMLQDSRVFAALGALHLPGPQGLLALLRAQGYSLKPLPLPFPLEIQASGSAAGQAEFRP
ncbi:MAG TPA: TraB/GumN family protein [Xanthomonadales bacterium]|nr:TraB/GumN family protein [Xanthomonadales bacterium]